MTSAESLAAVVAGIVGLAIGSFVGVVCDRVPAGTSVVTPGSRCDHCGRELSATENIPIVSYLVLRGRCHGCGEKIPPRDLFVELATAGLFVLLCWRLPSLWAVPAYAAFAAGAVALSLIDTSTHRLPSPVLYATGAVSLALLCVASAGTADWNRLLAALIGGAGAFLFFFLVFFASPKALGFGDVRLAALCGAMLGWIGLRDVPLGFVCGFLVAFVPAVFLLASGRANRKSKLAFGPFLSIGAMIGVLFGPAILRATGAF